MKGTNRLILISYLVTSGMCISTSVGASEVEVKFISPEKFTDVRLSNKGKKRSIKTVEKDVHKLFSKLSKDIVNPEQKLVIQVSNIDLPGYMDFMRGDGNNDIRIIKDMDFYKIEFSYELFDNSGVSLKSGEKKIKGFMNHRPSRLKSNKFGTVDYFANDIEEWLKSEFSS